MCRFALYMGEPILVRSLITDPVNSIIHQSFRSQRRVEPLNGDGFGIAWFVPEITDEPALFKSTSPAWNNPNLRDLARVTRTGCLLAHVRAASPGLSVSHFNCHPFKWGRFAFMHNGTLGGFGKLIRSLESELSDTAFHMMRGSTDSEHAFAHFLDLHANSTVDDPAERIVDALQSTIARLEQRRAAAGIQEASFLNFAVSDGRRAVVSRFASAGSHELHSLYSYSGKSYDCESGVCKMIPAETRNQAVIVASEPLTEDPAWREVPGNSVVIVHDDLRVEERAIHA